MANILQIETATQVCSAALSVNGQTVALKELMANNIHAGSLTLFIEEVMKTAALDFKDLDAVAVSMGPGSYTGLRIGVSTAKGLCFALDKPLIALHTLEMMAEGFLNGNEGYQGLVCPMIDARRMEVYCAVFDEALQVCSPVSARIIDAGSYDVELEKNKVTFIGDGAPKCAEVLEHPNAFFSDKNYNSAANMSMLAFEYFKKSKFEDVAYFEPFYLKDFVLTTPKKKV